MSLLATIRRDVSRKFAGELLSRTLFLLFCFYLGRRLGSADFGVFNLAISTAYLGGILFLDTGMNLSAVQLLVAEPERREATASTVFTAKLILFVPMCLALWLINHSLGNLPLSILLIASVYILGFNVLEYLSSITNAFHRMEIEAGLRILNRVAAVGLGLFAVRVGHIAAVLWALTAAVLLTSAVGIVILRRQLVRIRIMVDWALLKRIAVMGLPIAGTLIVGSIYLKWDLIVLSYFKIGKEQIGWYAGAFEIVEAFSALPGLLGAALFPLMVQFSKSDPMIMKRLLSASTKAVLVFAVPIAAIVSLLSHQIIGVIYGPAFLPGANVLAVLIWCIVPLFLYFYLAFVNVASGSARYNFMAGIVALLAGLAANMILVPRIGYMGAAWAALAANASYALLATWRVCVTFRGTGIPMTVLQLSAAAVLMTLAGRYAPVPLALRVLASITLFLAVLLVTGALNSKDFSLFWQIVQLRTPRAQEP